MFKVLIFTTKLTSIKSLLNDVIGKIPSLKLIGIVSNKKEFQEFKNNNDFDFILFHECEYNYQSIENDVAGIICIGNFKVSSRRYEKRITISNSKDNEFIIKQIEKFSKKMELHDIRKEAMEILLDLGFNFKHIGTKYLADAIQYCYTHIESDDCGDSCFKNLEREVYPYISKLNNTPIELIKGALTRTSNLMYLNHTTKSIKKLEEYFYLERLEKPTPKMVIGTITNNLLTKYHEY